MFAKTARDFYWGAWVRRERNNRKGAGKVQIVEMKVGELAPYEKNPRKNDDAVEYVANSIKEFGFKVPIVIDKNKTIVAGHTRWRAAKKLKLKTVPCIVADDLTEEQIRAFRLADNKTAEFADWDYEQLPEELAAILNIDMESFGFMGAEAPADVPEDIYSTKVNVPQYEITGACPTLAELIDTGKSDGLIAEIEESSVSQEEKEFLIEAAKRHTVFSYKNIAEYYAHATPEMQHLMEKSALVIIDFDDAIAYGYVQMSEEIAAIMDEDA